MCNSIKVGQAFHQVTFPFSLEDCFPSNYNNYKQLNNNNNNNNNNSSSSSSNIIK